LLYFLKILRSPNTPTSPEMIRIRLAGSGVAIGGVRFVMTSGAGKTLTGNMAKAESIRIDSSFIAYLRASNLGYGILVLLRRNLSGYPI
jgi:hypothetical protein